MKPFVKCIVDGCPNVGEWQSGKRERSKKCASHRDPNINKKKESRKFPYRKFRKTYCEKCGFVAQVMAQLDAHHKDGNCKNHNIENIETLCANCHRLVTFVETYGQPI